MKRQMMACVWVGMLLLALFMGPAVISIGVRIFSEAAPGGLRVSYYEGEIFEHFVCDRTERQVVKDYAGSPPAWRVPRNHFSAQWAGILRVPQDARYDFYLQSDDGARLFIDEEIIIDRWDQHQWAPGSSGDKQLARGKHSIRLEHNNGTGPAAIRLRWCGGPIPANTVLTAPYITKQ